MKMKSKMTAIFATLMIALMAVGVSYAMWSDTLFIDVTVNTGTVDVEWSLDGFGDDEIAGKDVSSINPVIVGNILTITIDNAYPCITYWVKFDIHCVGTVPVHIYGDYDLDKTDWPVYKPPDAGYQFAGVFIEWTDDKGTVIPTIYAYQLHEGEAIWGSLEVHFTNDMPIEQGKTYTISLFFDALQYNEAP